VLAGGLVAARDARARGLDTAPLYTIGLILVVSSLAGAKLYYLAEHAELLEPDQWFSSRGFTFYGGLIAAGLAIPLYVWRARLSVAYLDAVAVGLPLGIAIGRIGDVINGEHYGPPTDFFIGVKNTYPDADVPSNAIAYHPGGLYEVIIGAAVFAVVWPLRRRLRQPLAVMWLVLALLALARFAQFFVRSDSAAGALGLEAAQWTSLAMLVDPCRPEQQQRHVRPGQVPRAENAERDERLADERLARHTTSDRAVGPIRAAPTP
jgi:phosphatidylglycerol:prolipoprotein diacylglycerol transferase